MCILTALTHPAHALTLYDFGNPTAEEQQYIELINRARANPPAEGGRLANTTDPQILTAYSYFTVDLAMMQSEFNAIVPQPPLAPNASLCSSARSHSAWMLANATQAHDETNPSNTPFTRMTAAGYMWSTAGENIFASAESAWHGHAGFQVDWGSGIGGMQSPRGHRESIHSANFREIGVGVTLGTYTIASNTVGPQLVTQDFAATFTNPTLATGVAYYDLNTNGFYDIGEGIAGIAVNASGSGVTQYCTTAIGGGWVVPIPTTATTRTITFSGLNINQTASLVVPAATNAKVDLKLTYTPPTITSAATANTAGPYTLTFTAVGGATAYTWNRWTLSPAAADPCDTTTTVTTATTGTYAVRNTTVTQEGAASFHLENSTGNDQSLQLNALYYGQSTPTLTFQSQIRYATTAELFKVQIKEEGSLIWLDAFSQAGTGNSGETAFTQRTAPLSAMVGKSFRVRFLLNSTGSYFNGYSGDAFGWFIDAIAFNGVSSLDNNLTQTLNTTSGTFSPSAGTYLMALAPVISNRNFPASYQSLVVTTQLTATVTLGNLTTTYSGNPHPATATTSPAGLPVTLTYNGSTTPPTNPGSYTVVGTIFDASYQGSATGTMVISIIAPAILAQPVSPTITKNTSTNLTVLASGTALTYQWYSGTSPTTTTPIAGATAASFTTPTLTTTTNYWVRVSNPEATANSKTTKVTVTSSAVTRTIATWASEIELANSLPAGTIASVLADYDNDGRSNLMEYAFGTSPIVSNDAAPRMPVMIADPTYWILEYQRDTTLTDITFTALASSNLTTWKAPGDIGALSGFADTVVATTGTLQTHRASVPRSSSRQAFLRLRVTQP